MATQLQRCSWANTDNQLMQHYHDQEWGRPSHDSRHLFELLSLELMQAGLSWQTILNKRQNFKLAFANFDYHQVKDMGNQLPQLLENAGIIRNRRKIMAIITNAQAIATLERSGRSFAEYMWAFVDQQPIQHAYRSHEEVPATTDLAKKISRQMKRDGFAFAGPVVVYSFMQAAGLVNDHEVKCFCYNQLVKKADLD